MANTCTHIDQIQLTELPESIPGCEDCLKIGARWLHLRMCTSCGHIGCCDSSPNRHATAHVAETGHPVILVDTNVFVDLWTGDPTWADWSASAARPFPTSSSAPMLSSRA